MEASYSPLRIVQRKGIQMSQFTTPLKVELIDDYLFRTTDGFVYVVGSISGSEKIEVPAGFETDFVSTQSCCPARLDVCQCVPR